MYKFLLACLPILLFTNCETTEGILAKKYIQLSGKTMGTTYHIKYYDSNNRLLSEDITQLLIEVNNDLSTYIDTSFISKFNQSDSGILLDAPFASSDSPNRHFLMNYYRAKQIYKLSNGHFDPTIGPVVNYWGFGTNKRAVEEVDSSQISKMLDYIGYDLVELHEDKRFIEKKKKGVELDFSAIAKGYGVDAICELFLQLGIKDYYVEIGGEARANGKSPRERAWTVGINTPKEEAGTADFQTVVQLPSHAVATSGNYRNYYNVKGVKYAHTIDPVTGYPKKSDLLSASVFAEDCMTADALATACMVMGLEKAYKMIETEQGVEAYFIYGDSKGKMKTKSTSGMKKLILD